MSIAKYGPYYTPKQQVLATRDASIAETLISNTTCGKPNRSEIHEGIAGS